MSKEEQEPLKDGLTTGVSSSEEFIKETTMGISSIVLVAYFGAGILVLALFDLATKRIRTKLQDATAETQIKMASANVVLGHKTGMAVFLAVTWLFWPAVLVGAITKEKPKKDSDVTVTASGCIVAPGKENDHGTKE